MKQQRELTILLSLLAWMFSAMIGFWLGFRLSSYNEINEAFKLTTFVMAPSCLFLTLITPRHPWLCPMLAAGVIAIGVGANAMTDTGMDRNLWGIEAILAIALAVPGATVGGVIGVLLSRRLWGRGEGLDKTL